MSPDDLRIDVGDAALVELSHLAAGLPVPREGRFDAGFAALCAADPAVGEAVFGACRRLVSVPASERGSSAWVWGEWGRGRVLYVGDLARFRAVTRVVHRGRRRISFATVLGGERYDRPEPDGDAHRLRSGVRDVDPSARRGLRGAGRRADAIGPRCLPYHRSDSSR